MIPTGISPIIIGYHTETTADAWSPLTRATLGRLGIQPGEIAHVTTALCAPGQLYTERGLASSGHPCAGSACVLIQTNDGRRGSIDDIFYYDWNPHSSHAGGLRHWNLERRFVLDGRQVGKVDKTLPAHQIPDSPYLEISMMWGQDIQMKRVERDFPTV